MKFTLLFFFFLCALFFPTQHTRAEESGSQLLLDPYCGQIGRAPCVPGVNAPLPPRKTWEVVSVPTSEGVQSFEVLEHPFKLSVRNPSEPFDIIVRLLPYTDAHRQTEVYQRERKLVPRAPEDPDISGSFSSDVFEIAAKRNQRPMEKLPRPLSLTLPWPSDNYMKKVIHYWDGNKKEWLPLESTSDFDARTVTASWHLPYGQFAVFDSVDVLEGVASWYSHKTCDCAAIKEFGKGAKFRVTNITDGSPRRGKSVTVTINDYGPAARTKRLIDLDKFAFRKIANPRNGLALVRVELL